jgi:putative phosphoesterase
MLSLLVISDSHGDVAAVEKVLDNQLVLPDSARPTHLIHLGDGIEDVVSCKLSDKYCLSLVAGNCDSIFYTYSNDIPKEKTIELAGYKIFIAHGHTLGVKSGEETAIECAAILEADMVMFGHTHIPVSYNVKKGTLAGNTVLKKDLTVFNPGSLRYCRSFGAVTLGEKGILTSHGKI